MVVSYLDVLLGRVKAADKVAIIGMGCTKFGEHWDKSADDMLIESSQAALADAGLQRRAGGGHDDGRGDAPMHRGEVRVELHDDRLAGGRAEVAPHWRRFADGHEELIVSIKSLIYDGGQQLIGGLL